MTKKERHVRILEQIEIDKEVNIKLLSDLLNVSEMTIRRDIKELESLESNHIDQNYNMIQAIKNENSNKTKIGKEAAKLLKEKDVCFIDTGSTTVQMVDDIKTIRNLYVQTCNLEVLTQLSYNQNIEVYFSGGILHTNSQMCESRESIEFLKRNKSKYAFISAAGVDEDLGLTCANHYEIETKQTAMDNTKNIVLLVDSSKLGVISSSYFADLSVVDMIITDDGISPKWISILKDKNIKLIIADN